MSGFGRTCGLMVIVGLAVLLLLAACGGTGHKTRPGPIVPPTEQDQGVDIEAILATAAPEGIDAELWETLKSALVGEIVRTSAPQPYEASYNWSVTSDGFRWDNSFMSADGSDDSVVDIEDLVPIAERYEYYVERWTQDAAELRCAQDIEELARDWGLSCSGFRVEFSNASAEEGFAVIGSVHYDDYVDTTSVSRRYTFPCETRGLEPFWVRIWALDSAGEDLGYEVWEAPVTELEDPHGGAPDDYPLGEFALSLLTAQPPAVTWSTANLMTDGNQDGVVNDFDVGPIEDWCGAITAEEPLSTVADYDGTGVITTTDVTPLVAYGWGLTVEYFIVEVSAASAEEGFLADGTVDYFDSAGFNEFGFRYYEYEIAAPPEVPTYWVRVVPYSVEDERGSPGEVLEMSG